MLTCCKHHLYSPGVLSLGKQRKGKKEPESGPAPKKTSMMGSNYMGPKQLVVFMFKKGKKNPVCLFLRHQNLCCHSEHHQRGQQSPAPNATPQPHTRHKSRQDPCGWSPRWPEWTEWILHSWGALIFCLSVFTCMFIKNSSPSRQPSTSFSMWAAMLYYTWHLSIKEETLLKQTEVKLVLSSTSDLPLLLSSKGKFVLGQW